MRSIISVAHIFGMSGLLIVTVLGCTDAKKERGPGPDQLAPLYQPTFQDPTPGLGMTDDGEGDGGEIDTAGGLLLQSSVAELDEALLDLRAKARLVFTRLDILLWHKGRADFDDAFGVGLFDVLDMVNPSDGQVRARDLMTTEKIEIEIKDGFCNAGNEHRDGSARGTPEEGFICLSRPGLREVSPYSIQIETLALLAHEVGHLYGMNEDQAIKLQTFIVSHDYYFWPEPSVMTLLRSAHSQFYSNISNAVLFFSNRMRNDDYICNSIKDAFYTGQRLLQALGAGSESRSRIFDFLEIGPIWLFYVPEMYAYCGRDDLPIRSIPNAGEVVGDRQRLADIMFNVMERIVLRTQMLSNYIEGEPEHTHLQSYYLNALHELVASEDFANLREIDPREHPTIGDNHVTCRFFPNVNEQPQQFLDHTYSRFFPVDPEAWAPSLDGVGMRLYRANVNFTGLQLGVSLFQRQNTRGITVAVSNPDSILTLQSFSGIRSQVMRSEEVRVSRFVTGPGTIDEDAFQRALDENDTETVYTYQGVLVPGLNEFVQFDFDQGSDRVSYRCAITHNADNVEELLAWQDPETFNPSDPSPVAPEDDPSNEFTADLSADVHLSLYPGDRNRPEDRSAPALGTERITRIRYNGLIVLTTERDDFECIINQQRAEARGLNILELARNIRDGQVREVQCWKDGQELPLAPHAFHFEVQ